MLSSYKTRRAKRGTYTRKAPLIICALEPVILNLSQNL